MSYLNQNNIYSVASTIYNEVQKKYNINVEGYYLDDIQKVMHKLWEKNKNKGRNPEQLHGALNRKTVELVLPQVFRNIDGGFLNKTQNSMFMDRAAQSEIAQAHQNFQNPQMTSDSRNRTGINYLQEQQMRQVENSPINKFEQDPNEAFERLKKDRENEGNLAPVLKDQKNIYSNNSYQNRQPTYDNQLPMLPQTKEEIEPDANAERFINGNPLFTNERQQKVKDLGPTNAPGFFRPPDQFGTADQTGPTLDSFFKNAANLRGVADNNLDTSRQAENLDV